MDASKVIDNMIEGKLLNLHTAFVGKVLSVNGTKCTVQPLARIKAYGKSAQKQAVVTNVPILKHAQADVKKGSIVFCLCGERDIAETIKGNFATPPQGHHDLKDAVVVGVF